MSDNRLKIGITQGDTNGIGWEVILKTLADSRIAELCTPVVYGSPAAAGYYRRCIADLEEIAFNTVSSARDARRGRVNLIACGPQELRIVPGEPSPEAGRAAVEALQAAVRDLKEGALDALSPARSTRRRRRPTTSATRGTPSTSPPNWKARP